MSVFNPFMDNVEKWPTKSCDVIYGVYLAIFQNYTWKGL